MRILLFYQYFGTPKGSWSTRIYELAIRWVNAGNKVTVVTSPYEKSDIKAHKKIERQNIDGIDLIVINFPDSNRFGFFKRISNFILFSLMSVYFALKEPCDIVIASSGPITIGLPALFAKWIRRKKVIFEVRDLWPSGAIALGILTNRVFIKLAFFFEGLCYKSADCIVACSIGMVNHIQKRFPNNSYEVIPNGSDVALFRAKKELPDKHLMAPDKHLFVYAGSLGVMDDVKSVVEAAKVLQERGFSNIEIVIIGDGAERNELESLANTYNLRNIQFLGLIPKLEVIAWMQQAKATFVCFKQIPVLNTVSPNKMFDSFAAGVPIIQNTDGWIKEYVKAHQCGLNIDEGSDLSIVDAIVNLASDDDLQQMLALNAAKAAETDFCRDILANKYVSIMKQLVIQ